MVSQTSSFSAPPTARSAPTARTAFRTRRWLMVLGGALLASLGGCNAAGPPTFDVQVGQYQQAFNATREVLRDLNFELERVDAAQGVITTRDLSSAGFATPWDQVQTTPEQELADLVNNQSRRVRVVFFPAGEGADPIDPPSSDVACVGDVHVVIRRVQTALVRPNSRSVSLTTTAVDPALTAKQIWSTYEVPVSRDEALERRIARAIEAKLRDRDGSTAPAQPVAAAPNPSPAPPRP